MRAATHIAMSILTGALGYALASWLGTLVVLFFFAVCALAGENWIEALITGLVLGVIVLLSSFLGFPLRFGILPVLGIVLGGVSTGLARARGPAR